MKTLPMTRVRQLIDSLAKARVLVLGDVMLDRFVWGRVTRISPEAPVPIVEYDHESCMPGGAANVARNLTALHARAEIIGAVGPDESARQLQELLGQQSVGCDGLLPVAGRLTTVKTRIIASKQQVVRVDRETRVDLDQETTRKLLDTVSSRLPETDAVIIGDYAKGVVTQALLNELKPMCRERGIWMSFDPKPVHPLDLSGLSLLTPNRKEAFELAGAVDSGRCHNPLEDSSLLSVANLLLVKLTPALLLITLGDQGMLLCQRGQNPFHIPTVAKDVFDVSGAGDTVIGTFTLAIIAGASAVEAAIFSNHAAGVVVGKVGTATVTAQELLSSFA